MKKITAVLLAVCMLFGAMMMTSCSETVAEAVENAIKKTNELNSYQAVMKMEITASSSGIEMTIPITYDMKVKDAQTDKPIISADITTSVMGIDMNMDMYSENEWVYLVTSGKFGTETFSQSYKQKLSANDGEFDLEASVDEIMQDIPKEWLEGVEFKINDDKSKTVSLTLTGEQFKEVYPEIIESANAQSGEGVDIDNISIKDATVTVTIADGYVKAYGMSFAMDVTVAGVTATSEADVSIEFSNYNADLTITAPEGYKDFEELSET